MNFLTKINYMKYAKVWIAVSIVLTIAGLAAFFTKGMNKGVDFTGGLIADVQFDKHLENAEVEKVVKDSVGGTPVIQKAEVTGSTDTSKSQFIIRTRELAPEEQDKLYKDLETLGKFERIGEEHVSASVSSELTEMAALAVAIAAILQIVYLALRFQLKFGVTAVLALLHDVVITIGLVSIFQIQINSPFVAAILTILGYSINDTVIVFDRIREHLETRKKNETLEDLTTRAIQETMTRSIFTVLTVEITLVALLIWGGSSIWDMAMSLFIGISSGMYSSIFIAAALWLFWQQAEDNKKKTIPGGKSTKPAKPAKA